MSNFVIYSTSFANTGEPVSHYLYQYDQWYFSIPNVMQFFSLPLFATAGYFYAKKD